MKQFRQFTLDAKKKMKPNKKFSASKSAQLKFEKSLRTVARMSGKLVNRYIDGATITDLDRLLAAVNGYAKQLEPWAREQSKKLIADTEKRVYQNYPDYMKGSEKISKLLASELDNSVVGTLTKLLVEEQVDLIKSLPLEAAQRAQELVREGIAGGRRVGEIAAELELTTSVTESRAMLIARTETARTNTALNEARATSVGSEEYIWRNSGDKKSVRHSHWTYKGKPLDGQRFRWDKPPTLDDGTTGHPGTFPNCMCYPEAVLPDE